jgi:hypothetical protein
MLKPTINYICLLFVVVGVVAVHVNWTKTFSVYCIAFPISWELIETLTTQSSDI